MKHDLSKIAMRIGAGFAFIGASCHQTIDQLRWQRRVLLIAAATSHDPRLATQTQSLDRWRSAAADRDLTMVVIEGRDVAGVSDTAVTLRRRYRLPAASFTTILIGKDGHVASRSTEPVPAATLMDAIDAMPMRRAGQR